MRSLALFLVAGFAVTATAVLDNDLAGYQNDHHDANINNADDKLGHVLSWRQQDVNRLLYKVEEPIRSRFKTLKHAESSYNPKEHLKSFRDCGKAVTKLIQEIDDHRVLEQKHWFSLFNDRQREEALMLFDVFDNAKDWETFRNSAAYFRTRVNEGQFVYALYVAVIHSDLGDGIVLPPLYEVTPHLFTNSDVIHNAYTAKMTQSPGKFDMGYTGSKKNPEQRVAYFGEDIGMNNHHVTWHMNFPFWWDSKRSYSLDRKGELFFWMHHQLTARFDAERLSNYLPIVDALHWEKPIKEGFAPHTTYRHGGAFPARPDNVEFEDVEGVARIRDLLITESRIQDAIDHGYVTNSDGLTINILNNEGIEILGSILESSEDSPNVGYYGSLHNTAHAVLGRQGDPKGKFNQPPGVMEHFETATRDPAFFRLHKYMDNIFKHFKDSLPPYTKEEIEFDNVVINSLSVDGKFETFFEDFEFSLLQAVDDTDELPDVEIDAHVSRLNHKPFTIQVDVENKNCHDVLATFRVYLCPYRDQNGNVFSFDEGRWTCIELDKFWKTLKEGQNRVERASSESTVTAPDIPSFNKIIQLTDEAVKTSESEPDEMSTLNLQAFARSCGIPHRMLLPKGNTKGLEFRLVVAVTDGGHDSVNSDLENMKHSSHSLCGIHGGPYPDVMPMGFPLDRSIPDERVLIQASNIKDTIVHIFHI